MPRQVKAYVEALGETLRRRLKSAGAAPRHLEYAQNLLNRLFRLEGQLNVSRPVPLVDAFEPVRMAWAAAARGQRIWWGMTPVKKGAFNTQLFYKRPSNKEAWPIRVNLTSILQGFDPKDRAKFIRQLERRISGPALVHFLPKTDLSPPDLRSVADNWPGEIPNRASRRARPELTDGRAVKPFTYQMARALLDPYRYQVAKLLGLYLKPNNKPKAAVFDRTYEREIDAAMEELATGVALSGHFYIELDLAASTSQQIANLKALHRKRRVSMRQLYQLDGATFVRIMCNYTGGETSIHRIGLSQPLLGRAIAAGLLELGIGPSNRPRGTVKRYRQQLALTLANTFAHHRGEILAKVDFKPSRRVMRDYAEFVRIVFEALPRRLRSYKTRSDWTKGSIALAREGRKQRRLAIERVHADPKNPHPERLNIMDPSN